LLSDVFLHAILTLFSFSIQIINKWEQSGNGNGNKRDAPREAGVDPEAGHLEPDELKDDNRASFLHICKSHILHFWHLMDTCQLLSRSMARLKAEQSASSLGVPKTQGPSAATQRKRKAEQEKAKRDEKMKSSIYANIGVIAAVSAHKELQAARGKIESLKEKILLADDKNPALKNHYEECLKNAEQDLESLQHRLRTQQEQQGATEVGDDDSAQIGKTCPCALMLIRTQHGVDSTT